MRMNAHSEGDSDAYNPRTAEVRDPSRGIGPSRTRTSPRHQLYSLWLVRRFPAGSIVLDLSIVRSDDVHQYDRVGSRCTSKCFRFTRFNTNRVCFGGADYSKHEPRESKYGGNQRTGGRERVAWRFVGGSCE